MGVFRQSSFGRAHPSTRRSATTPSRVEQTPDAKPDGGIDTQAPLDPSMGWIENVGKPPTGSRPRTARASRAPATTDRSYARTEPVPVRRLVYRVRFVVPRYFRAGRQTLHPGAAELHIDVGHERLRARFVGRGWPVHEGSEIRLRSDTPGVYLFDGFGGRTLSSGEMATWFDGRQGARASSRVRIRREFGPAAVGEVGPGALVCALLAEWTNQPRENLLGRCRGGSIPPGFRFGPWSAELTAILPMKLPRHALRADDQDAPEGLRADHKHAMLSAVELEQVQPTGVAARADAGQDDAGLTGAGGAAPNPGLSVHNLADARIIVLASGVPLGWVDPGHRVRFPIKPGSYRVGAVRPLGIVRRRATKANVPTEIRVDAPRRRPPQQVTPRQMR